MGKESYIHPEADEESDGRQPIAAVPTVEFNWFFSLKDPFFQKEYDAYRMDEASLGSKILFLVVGFSVVIGYFIELLNKRTFANSLFAFLTLLRIVCPIMYTYIATRPLHKLKYEIRIPARYLGDIILLLRVSVLSYRILEIALAGQCSTRPSVVTMDCNPLADQNQLPMLTVIQLMLGTILIPLMFRCHTPWVNFFQVFVCFASLAASMVIVKYSASEIMIVATLLIITNASMHEFEHALSHSFTAYMNLEQATRQKAIAENEKRVIEDNARDLRHFIGNVAHDLKTPLQAFLSELNCLEGSGAVGTAAGRSSLQSLKGTCHYMTMTINRSLDFVKSTSGFKLLPKAETVDVQYCFEWVRGCISQYTRSDMRIVLEPIGAAICRHVITDRQWLLENLLCLASNSVKYIGDGGEVRFRVGLEAVTPATAGASSEQSSVDGRRSSNYTHALRFEVEDNGVGIPEEKMVTLFQPFRQAQRNAGGTGLGLFALANRSVAIGGTYGVSKRRDGRPGVVFWFTIPYRPDNTISAMDNNESDAALVSQIMSPQCVDRGPFEDSISTSAGTVLDVETKRGSENACSSRGMQVLLVEDTPLIQKASTRLLRNHGITADVANNGMECLQRIREKRYDLILMDINMPVMDGLETIKHIREDEAACGMESQHDDGKGGRRRQFVIGISADSDTETRDTALAAGMDDFVDKPLDISTLKKKCMDHDLLF